MTPLELKLTEVEDYLFHLNGEIPLGKRFTSLLVRFTEITGDHVFILRVLVAESMNWQGRDN